MKMRFICTFIFVQTKVVDHESQGSSEMTGGKLFKPPADQVNIMVSFFSDKKKQLGAQRT